MSAIDTANAVQRPQLRAVSYLRVSTEEQKKGYGIASQDRKTTAWMSRHGHHHVHTYKDEGVSGSLEMGSRPDFDQLMADAHRTPRPFDLVAVPAGDRIGRTDRAFWRWVWALEDIGIFVALVNKNVDNTTDEGRDAMREEANYAFKEYTRIRQRTQGGIQEKAEEGGHPGGIAPYGYRIENQGRKGESRLVPDRCDRTGHCFAVHEVDVLHRAWHLTVIEHKNCRQTAIQLNIEGLYTRSGKPWSAVNLGSRLRSKAVQTGRVVYRNPESAGKNNGTKIGMNGTPVYGDTVIIPLERIFTMEQVERLNKALARNSRTRTTEELPPHPLSKRVFGECGAHYTGLNRTDRSGRMYRCSGKIEKYAKAAVCTCSQVDADALEERVWTGVCELLGDPGRLQAMSEDWLGLTAGQKVNHASRIADLDKQIAAQDTAIAAVVVAAAQQTDAATAIGLAIKDLKAKRTELVRLREEAMAWQTDTETAARRASDLQALAEMARYRLHDMDAAEQAEVLELLDVRVTLTGPVPKKTRKDDTLTSWFRTRGRPVPLLTDEAWAKIEPLFTASDRRPRAQRLAHRTTVTAILYKARTGAAWKGLPAFFGPYTGIVTRYQRWVASGLWEQAMDLLEGMDSTQLPPTPYPLPPLKVEGRVDPRLLIGIQAAPGETVPSARAMSQGNSYVAVIR